MDQIGGENEAVREAGDAESPRFVVGVGVGAATGEGEALGRFFEALQTVRDAAIILIESDASQRVSDVLSKHAKMPLQTAKDGARLGAGRIYVADSGALPHVDGGRVRLSAERGANGAPPEGVLDNLLRSLAEAYGVRAAGVVLGDAGEDGGQGLKAITAAGGFSLAQARSGDQPSESPLAFSGSPEAIGRELSRRLAAGALGRVAQPLLMPERVEEIVEILRRAQTHDFSGYRRATLDRRIARRLAALSIADIDEYIDTLSRSETERKELARQLLIGSTGFFRDPACWDGLARTALDPLFRSERSDSARMWSVGCATGEEAYGLAMLAVEARERANAVRPIKIFATDVDQRALNVASAGVYSASTLGGVSEERRERFFVRKGDDYQAIPELRELIFFARHDALIDPPFARLNVVCCRNLLIYLEDEAQVELLGNLAYALDPNGRLLIGSSDATSHLSDAFVPLDGVERIYSRRSSVAVERKPTVGALRSRPWRDARSLRRPPLSGVSLKTHVLSSIAAEVAAPSLVVTEACRLVYTFGDLSAVAKLPNGEMTQDACNYLLPPLRPLLPLSVREAARLERGAVTSQLVLVGDGPSARQIRMDVRALPPLAEEPPYFLASFHETSPSADAAAPPAEGADETGYAARLEVELQRVKDTMTVAVERLEISNKELQLSSDHLAAANEELQSSNEQLIAANGRLEQQNRALQARISQLIEVSDDFDNILRSSEVGLIFLDGNLNIRRFTPTMATLMPLVEHDVGRSILAFHLPFNIGRLDELCARVMATKKGLVREVEGPERKTFVFNVFPFVTEDEHTSGVVIKVTDISAARAADEARRRSERQVLSMLDLTPVPMVFVSGDLQITRVNAKLCELLGYRQEELTRRPLSSLFKSADPMASLSELRSQMAERSGPFLAEARDGRAFPVELAIGDAPAGGEGDAPIVFRDLDASRRTEDELKQALAKLRSSNKELERFGSVVAHDLKEPLRAVMGYAKLLASDARDALDEQGRDFIDRIVRSAGRMQLLIDDLLSLASVDSDERPMRDTPLEEVVAEAKERLAAMIDQTGAAITVTKLPTVAINRQAVVQLLQNLIGNAIKYRSDRPPNIAIAARRRRDSWEIAVSDNGVGIDQIHQQKIFDVFTRLDNRRSAGTGIGLALAKKIVERHKGEIWVESTVGEGSTFYFTLADAPDGVEPQ